MVDIATDISIRPAVAEDAAPIARVHVESWRSTYAGILPDLFREGQGVVAEGTLEPDGRFTAREVLAKHDETYMPKEVADALRESGQWRDGDAAR